ncbi:DUF3223 domain-containing protein [Rhodopseudomonas palustris]|nr:DUF3223 domain-containing protein [Rhodopseudomonas palustris]
MASIPVVVGRVTFPSKKSANSKVQEIYSRHTSGVCPLTGADLEFALDVLDLHPQRASIIAEGCTGIVVKQASDQKTRCLAVIQDNGEMEEFSARVALGIAPCKPMLSAAARNAVAKQIQEFKARAFAQGSVLCATSGARLSFEDAHVDHAPKWTFKAIVEAFKQEHPDTPITHLGTQDLFQNSSDADAFRAFHDVRAHLRIVDKKENLSTLRRSPKSAPDEAELSNEAIKLSKVVVVSKMSP